MEQHSNKWLQHFILLTAPLLTVIDIFIVNIAMPSIKQSFNASDGAIELVVATYLLGFASFQVTGSRAGDIFGRKKIFLWGMFFFVLTSCICGLAPNVIVLIAARFFQGVSGAFMQSQALAYVQVLFPERKERTKAIGYIGITLGIASLLPLLILWVETFWRH
jgi:MFS family permease